MKVVKGYQLPVIRRMSSEDVMYIQHVIIVNTALHIRKLLRQ